MSKFVVYIFVQKAELQELLTNSYKSAKLQAECDKFKQNATRKWKF